MSRYNSKKARRDLRHSRVRKKIMGTSECPRMVVFRSLKHIYAQVIDDIKGETIVAASTLEKEIRPEVADKNPKETAFIIGEHIGKKVLEKGLKQVVFDRAGYKYHGRVAELANGARSAGLDF